MELEVSEGACNCPFYHDPHTFTIVTSGLSRKPMLMICEGTFPDKAKPKFWERR